MVTTGTPRLCSYYSPPNLAMKLMTRHSSGVRARARDSCSTESLDPDDDPSGGRAQSARDCLLSSLCSTGRPRIVGLPNVLRHMARESNIPDATCNGFLPDTGSHRSKRSLDLASPGLHQQ